MAAAYQAPGAPASLRLQRNGRSGQTVALPYSGAVCLAPSGRACAKVDRRSSSTFFAVQPFPPARRTRFIGTRAPQLAAAAVPAAASAAAADELAGHPVVILPGLGNCSADYDELQELLRARGAPAYVLPVSRLDWLRNARGLLQRDWWAGRLRPLPILAWYVERVAAAVEEARAAHGRPVTLLGHSAGGWLARVYLAQVEGDPERVRALVTLGTPHLAPPEGTLDQTRGLLTCLNAESPGAYYADRLKYVNVIGLETRGRRLGEGTFSEWFAGLGYKQVCGVQETDGDFVVPVDAALLEGAEHIKIDGVFHSPVGAKEGRPWYGSEGVLEEWVHHLFE
eukprot:tig00001373_g8442.t1